MSLALKIAVIGAKNQKGIARTLANDYRVFTALSRMKSCDATFIPYEKAVYPNYGIYDLIMTFKGGFLSGKFDALRAIAKTKRAEAKTILWMFDACNPADPHGAQYLRSMRIAVDAHLIDWVVTTENSGEYASIFPNYLHVPQGVLESEFSQGKDYSIEVFDLLYMGSLYRRSPHREGILKGVAASRKVACYTDSILNGGGARISLRPTVYSDDPAYRQAFNEAKVAYVPRFRDGLTNFWSNRIYLMAAMGIPCLVEYVPGLEKEFDDGKHVVFARDEADFCNQLQLLLDDPVLRVSIGEAGRKHVLENYKYSDRLNTILSAVGAR
jgi:glycosyltransferase involved in cell wall biosynthesis